MKVIRKRQDEQLKKHFSINDHLTPLNAQFLRDLNQDERIHQAWYYNGKVFATDTEGRRHKFDILENVREKVKNPFALKNNCGV